LFDVFVYKLEFQKRAAVAKVAERAAENKKQIRIGSNNKSNSKTTTATTGEAKKKHN